MGLSEEAGRLFEFLKRRRINYKTALSQPAMQEMLVDLADFCRAAETCVVLDSSGHVDQERSLIMEGRREVWLRIQNHLQLTTEQIYRISTGKPFSPGASDE